MVLAIVALACPRFCQPGRLGGFILAVVSGQLESSMYCSAARVMPSSWSPSFRVKSSETRQPGSSTPSGWVIFWGENPSELDIFGL